MSTSVAASQLKQMVICASAAISAQRQQINDLNVFPVPDGDTGTNMSLTIGAASADLKKADFTSVSKVASATANALLRGARGNSGVILSLLFRGFSKSLKGKDVMTAEDFANAIADGVRAAYKAVMQPAEGTILTVSRLSAAAAMRAAKTTDQVEDVMQAAIDEANATLPKTTDMNPVLKKAGVVDAGGVGYTVILQGMLDALRGATEADFGAPEGAAAPEKPEEGGAFSKFETEEITYTYCTEFIVERANNKDPALLRAYLAELGDSLVFVDDEEIIKVHVHTNHPGKAMEKALAYGAFVTVKVENMKKQHTQAVIQEQAKAQETASDTPEREIVPAEKKFGFVSVCAGDGIEGVFRDLGVDGIVSGGQTMNPATEDILKVIDHTPAEVVYVLPNNKNIIMAAQQCVRLSPEKKVIVIGSTTIPEGVAAMLSVESDDEAEITAAMEAAVKRVTTAQITYAARDSDFDGHDIKQGDFMSLLDGKLRGNCGDPLELMRDLAQEFNAQGREFITVFYGSDVDEEHASWAEKVFTECCPDAEVSVIRGGQPVYYFIISAE